MSNERLPPDCTVVVAGCDKYADLLAPFSALWRKFWPDCPFETVLLTETVPCDGFGVIPVPIGFPKKRSRIRKIFF